MKKILISLALVLFTYSAFAQDSKGMVSTSIENGRYEIVMSNILAKLTFKLDKY